MMDDYWKDEIKKLELEIEGLKLAKQHCDIQIKQKLCEIESKKKISHYKPTKKKT